MESGRFKVYAVDSIDEGMSLLTGRPAGERDKKGAFPEDSINGLVESRIRAFTTARQAFAKADGSTKESADD